MKLNEKILFCRKKCGLSQLDLADLLGVSRQSVSKWETGEANPEVTKIPQMAKAFGVTADWLLSNDDPSEPVEAIETPERNADYPGWVDNLPKNIGNLIRKYGWIYGVRTAIGGAVFAGMGALARAIFHAFIFSSDSGMFDPFAQFNQTAWRVASLFTGAIIALGAAVTIGGICIAIALKKWGNKK